MITVFYDGKCGLCSKEINHYRKIEPSNIFNWQDITESNSELSKEGITLAEGLRLLRSKDSRGQIHVGVDAFILIWKQLTRWRVLAFLVGLPIIRQIANTAYRAFANWRFKKFEHCQLAARQEKK